MTKINVWEEWHYAHSVINWNEEARREIARKANDDAMLDWAEEETTMFWEWVKDLNDTVGGCEFCGNTKVVGVNGYGERYCAGCLQDMIDSIDDAMLGRAR